MILKINVQFYFKNKPCNSTVNNENSVLGFKSYILCHEENLMTTIYKRGATQWKQNSGTK